MLVVLFWILLLLILLSLIALIVFLVIKKRSLIRISSTILITSIIAFGFTLKACSDKVKSDFGYREDTRTEEEKEKEERRIQEELNKTKQEFEASQRMIDSLKNK